MKIYPIEQNAMLSIGKVRGTYLGMYSVYLFSISRAPYIAKLKSHVGKPHLASRNSKSYYLSPTLILITTYFCTRLFAAYPPPPPHWAIRGGLCMCMGRGEKGNAGEDPGPRSQGLGRLPHTARLVRWKAGGGVYAESRPT